MSEKTKENEELVSCEICLKELSKAEAKSAEAQDYVLNFCGIDCYKEWQKKSEEDKEKK
ncbi:MAG: DUF3330 domain-containing protein [Spirochaetia bacterium]|nr:DUF3330 domain-containing protein [Spirochaetia bacterium]